MTGIDVYICICRHTDIQSHRLFSHHKLCHDHLLLIVVFIEDMYLVVAAQFQPTTVVRNLKLIMGIRHRSIHGVGIVIDSIIIKAFQPVTLEELLGGCPVCLTTLDSVDITVIGVREFVEGYVEDVVATQPHDSR